MDHKVTIKPPRNLSGSPYSETDSNYKYNSMYNKILIELLLHKNRYNEALDVFTSNVNYFNTEEDFFNMISRARDLKKFDDVKIITKRWLDLDSSSISAHKISFANSIELLTLILQIIILNTCIRCI